MIVPAQALDQYVASLDFKDAYTPSGIRLTHTLKDYTRMGAINDLTTQNLAVKKSTEIIGEKAATKKARYAKR